MKSAAQEERGDTFYLFLPIVLHQYRLLVVSVTNVTSPESNMKHELSQYQSSEASNKFTAPPPPVKASPSQYCLVS